MSTRIDDPVLCSRTICNPVFSNKKCKCFTHVDTNKPYEEQFCGFQDGDRIVACDSGCCKSVCPNKKNCPSIPPREPDSVVKTSNMVIVDDIEQIENKFNFQKRFDMIINILMILSIVTTLAIAVTPKINLKNLFN